MEKELSEQEKDLLLFFISNEFISNEDMTDIIKIMKSLEDLGVALLAPLAVSLVEPVLSSLLKV